MRDSGHRETATGEAPVAPQARALFDPSVFEGLERFAQQLADDGVTRGLIGPREADRLWDRHLLNCAVIAPLFAPDSTVCDVGSGAGLPGLVLGIARPDLQMTLVEPLLRRTVFLDAVVAHLDLTNVEVVRERAEAMAGKRRFDAVTSRAVAPLSRLIGWCMPLVGTRGEMHAMKGSRAEAEVDEAAHALRRAGCAQPRITYWGDGVVSPQTTVVSVARAERA